METDKDAKSRQLFVHDVVKGNFAGNRSQEYKSPLLEVKIHRGAARNDEMHVVYALESEKGILETVGPRLAVSQIVHSIYGTGFGNHLTRVYEVRKGELHQVGSVRNSRKPHYIAPLFSNSGPTEWIVCSSAITNRTG